MKFVALVSGGKDSCYNILHCIRQGHELVALANLHPLDESLQELDSFMFQTVGHDIVSHYGKCTGLPLFRHQIKAQSSKNVSLNYYPTKDDEIEDLYQLLKDVKNELPDVQAVSVGAILSSYQRTRVEDVCGRLGLTVLSYLWHRDQLELMTEMCSMSKLEGEEEQPKMDARLIKVAAVGLDATHLGKSLPQVFPTLQKLNNMYEVHICGEGGEFETMVLDAPFFTKGRLNVESTQLVSSRNNDGVYNIQLNVKFFERGLDVSVEDGLRNLAVPPVLNEQWMELYNELKDSDPVQHDSAPSISGTHSTTTSINEVGNILYISNLKPSFPGSTAEQALDVFKQLDTILNERGLYPSQVLSCALLLSDISAFALVNDVYNKFFNIWKIGPLPPSRSCVGSKLLGKDVALQLSIAVDTTALVRHTGEIMLNDSKDGLHVQGRSYWCPCNIGPYSQAIWNKNDRNKVCYISGQIALVPSSMDMVKTIVHDQGSEAVSQSVLSLRHFDTLKNTIGVESQLAMVCYVSQDYMVPIVTKTWSLYCSQMSYKSDLWIDKDDNIFSLIVVRVSELPKNALCEWGGIACAELNVEDDYDEDDLAAQIHQQISLKNQLDVCFPDAKDLTVSENGLKRHFVTLFSDSLDELSSTIQNAQVCQITLYYTPSHTVLENFSHVEYCPVNAVYDYQGKKRQYGLHIKY